ncbi:MAG: hypothetical protein RL166_992 [Actinomycetota bacterium]|jgi:uncharacterized Tic20 family protein
MSENNDVYAKPLNMTPENERLFAILTHVAGIPFEFFGPLVGYLIFNGKGPFISHHVKESLNFGINMVLWFVILAISIVGWLVIWAVPVVWVIFRIVAAVQASQGVFYKYPLTIRFIK